MSQPFVDQPDQLLSAVDLDQVQAETFVRRVEFHEQLPSTNDHALKFAADNAGPYPLLVVTNRQTGGRGRGSNAWWAGHGSLTFSLLLEAEHAGLPQSRWPQVSLHVGLAVGEAIDELLGNCIAQLKWPNDVYLDSRKVCGVLVEVPATTPPMLVLGVGVNVNNTLADAPQDVASSAIALCEAAGHTFSLATVLSRLLARISERLSWIGSRDDELRRRWRERCLLTGRQVRLQLGARCIEGLCQGIDDEGALIIETANEIERCYGGVVTHF